jgi:DNA polymerase-3 subunit gamma/tau
VAAEDLPGVFTLAGEVVEAGFDLRVVCRELAKLVRDLLVVQIDPRRLADREIAAEGEEERLEALAASFSREDLMRSFDLLGRAELEIKASSQPRHHFEMMLVKWIHLQQLTPIGDLIGELAGGGDARPRPAPARLGPKAASRSGPPPPGRTPAAPEPPPPVSGPAPAVRRAAPEARGSTDPDPKAALLSAIREQNKVFYGMVVAQAQTVEVEGDTVVFTFAPVHKTLRGRLEEKRAWLEQLGQSAVGRRLKVTARESAAPAPPPVERTPAARTRPDLVARAQAEPAVQAVLDVFGGQIEDVEELDGEQGQRHEN